MVQRHEEDIMGAWRLRKFSGPGLILVLLLLFSGPALATVDETSESYRRYGAAEAQRLTKQPPHWITADHSKHEALKVQFDKPEEVTAACLSCHNEAGFQMMDTIHWTWICPADPSGKMGKAGLTLNNF